MNLTPQSKTMIVNVGMLMKVNFSSMLFKGPYIPVPVGHVNLHTIVTILKIDPRGSTGYRFTKVLSTCGKLGWMYETSLDEV